MHEHDVLPVNAFYGYLDSQKVKISDVEDFITGIEASEQYSWMGAIEGRRLNNTTEVIVFLLGRENTGAYMPHHLDEIARYTGANHFLNKKLAPLIKIDVDLLDPIDFDMLGAQEYMDEAIQKRRDASIIFSVDLLTKLPIPIER